MADDDLATFIDQTYEPPNLGVVNVASRETINAVFESFRTALRNAEGTLVSPSDEAVRRLAMEIVRVAGDRGSSALTTFDVTLSSVAVPMQNAVDVIKGHCTLRQFCMFFARWYWRFCLSHNRPPANWSKWGLQPDCQFAGFDFFDGVNHPDALPVNIPRQPTARELIAGQTLKAVHIFRATRGAGSSTVTVAEITGGRSDTSGKAQLALPPPPS